MPTYEYVCPEGHAFDKIQRMIEKPRAKCPVCGRAATRKISGGAGLVFKGTGFYITDYGKDGKGPRKAPVESEGKPSEKSSEAKSSDAKASDSKSSDSKSSDSKSSDSKSSDSKSSDSKASERKTDSKPGKPDAASPSPSSKPRKAAGE